MPSLQEDRCCDGWDIGFDFRLEQGVFLSLKHQVWPWGTPSLQSIMYGAVFVGIKRSGSKMRINLNLSSEFKKQYSPESTNTGVFIVRYLTINQLGALISQIYFRNETLHVSDNSSVHHQEFFTVNTTMVYVIQVCSQLAGRIRTFNPDPARKLTANLYDIYHCCVYSEKLLMMDRGTVRNM